MESPPGVGFSEAVSPKNNDTSTAQDNYAALIDFRQNLFCTNVLLFCKVVYERTVMLDDIQHKIRWPISKMSLMRDLN